MSNEEKDIKQENTTEEPVEETTEEVVETEEPSEVEKLQQELEAAQDKYLRSQAEIQNIQTRQQKELAQFSKYEGQSLAKEILPALDNLQRALQVQADDEASSQLKKGIELTYNALIKALNDKGITEVEAEGATFDPNYHQAVQTVEATEDHPKDTVVEVYQPGYLFKDRILRPAMVSVAN
ncbi:nucleotide exchange factor GrpE [Holzapfeliella floricola]|uniref:nucleotide exchange factor GrpE n=1 Tax=Holzapfeliella floricola TaxID=679249 RepID=UPI000AA4B683